MLESGFHNMDCMYGMAQFPDKFFNLAIVDPPYRNASENQPTKDMRNNGSMDGFGDKPTPEYFNELFRVSKEQIIWGANNFDLPNYKGFVVWKKLTISDAFTMSMAEIAFISEGIGTTSKVFECAPQGTKNEPRIHPTQKPIALYKWLLSNYAKPGDKILDTHVGSASSLIACHQMGFEYWGFELDTDYFKAATERLNKAKAQVSITELVQPKADQIKII
jgi:site-specific DNA-methyltransferase (adenine-specific)